jgi:hypothetical protein
MEELRKLHRKPKVTIIEINRFILENPLWGAAVVQKAFELEMYNEFCVTCTNFDVCWEKLGSVKRDIGSGCICNGFYNHEQSDENRQKLRAYFKAIQAILNL